TRWGSRAWGSRAWSSRSSTTPSSWSPPSSRVSTAPAGRRPGGKDPGGGGDRVEGAPVRARGGVTLRRGTRGRPASRGRGPHDGPVLHDRGGGVLHVLGPRDVVALRALGDEDGCGRLRGARMTVVCRARG